MYLKIGLGIFSIIGILWLYISVSAVKGEEILAALIYVVFSLFFWRDVLSIKTGRLDYSDEIILCSCTA